MSEKVNEQEAAKFEDWPLSKNWWLHIQSERGNGYFTAFDFIKISAQGPDNYSRPITSIMVPKIDGLVCESHSFISYLINQNLESVKVERDRLAEINKVLVEALEWLIIDVQDYETWQRPCAAVTNAQAALAKAKEMGK